MRISDARLDELRERGFIVVEGFLDDDTLKAAQDALWDIYPRPEEYFANPEKYKQFTRSQFAGVRLFPYYSWALNRVPVYLDLIDAAERFLGSRDLEIYKIELMAKYSGGASYDQPHHRDYTNHTIVVPRKNKPVQMTSFILLSDVTEDDGPTKLLPLQETADIPMVPQELPHGDLFDREIAATGPAGSIMIYRPDVFHRASGMKGEGRSRFVMPVDYQLRGHRWNGKIAWPNQAEAPGMTDAIVRMSPRQRDLFGWPPPGSDYWDAQTLADVAARYPGIDLSSYGG